MSFRVVEKVRVERECTFHKCSSETVVFFVIVFDQPVAVQKCLGNVIAPENNEPVPYAVEASDPLKSLSLGFKRIAGFLNELFRRYALLKGWYHHAVGIAIGAKAVNPVAKQLAVVAVALIHFFSQPMSKTMAEFDYILISIRKFFKDPLKSYFQTLALGNIQEFIF